MHDLVVRERQDEVLVPGVDHRERQLVVVEAAVHGLLREVLERVVHPAHVPLEAEAETAEIGRPRDARPGGRLLRDRHHARLAAVDDLVQLAQEGDGLQVLAAAVDVRHPLAVLARVVEVEHRGDGVDAEAVGVVLAQPVERVREQEVAHLVAAEVEDQRAPVGMRAAARILVLVERRPVEARERELVAREVRGHPVEDDADPGLVERVHERPEVIRLSHRRDGRIEAGHLVAPGPRERVVHHRQELDVREAEIAHVGDELLGELPPAEPQPPRLGVHLVDRDRLLQLVEAPAPLEPAVVGPLVARAVDPRGRLRRDLRMEGERVGLQAQLPVGAVHLELVRIALGGLGHHEPPRSRTSPAARAAARARPRGSSRRRPRRRARSAPRPRTRPPRR